MLTKVKVLTETDLIGVAREINQWLQLCSGQLVMLILKSGYSFFQLDGFIYTVPRCCKEEAIVVGVISDQMLMVEENGTLVLTLPNCLTCYGIDFDWRTPDANLIKKAGGLKVIFYNGDININNNFVVSDEEVYGWLHRYRADVDRAWGYIPLAYMMSNILGRSIQLTDLIRESFTDDQTVPGRNLQIVLKYQLTELYRQLEFNFMLPGVLDELLQLLPRNVYKSNLNDLCQTLPLAERVKEELFEC